MQTLFDVWRLLLVVWIGLLIAPMLMIGWRRRNIGIFACAIFAATGAVVSADTFGQPYEGVQLPMRTTACLLTALWLWQQRHDPAIDGLIPGDHDHENHTQPL